MDVTKLSKVGENITEQDEEGRPWYMSGGKQWPLPAAKSPKSGSRMALLWPEEDPGSDRIMNQLMFVPPSYSANEASGQRLKKILFYYGQKPWFPLKEGRDQFREARCPVDKCNITMDQKQTTDADAIVYQHLFTLPHHTRPPRQVRIVQLPY
jgi:glycoprotein 3-alpha-L-fucosyltransferase